MHWRLLGRSLSFALSFCGNDEIFALFFRLLELAYTPLVGNLDRELRIRQPQLLSVYSILLPTGCLGGLFMGGDGYVDLPLKGYANEQTNVPFLVQDLSHIQYVTNGRYRPSIFISWLFVGQPELRQSFSGTKY
ncbi:hypothetical protein An04g06220 [Aspergillus niger]|uniref:Uncharacterized protein n=2 Tax=Aspergillus niger TaxID=5061 RepID=A2QJ89_ASPNC|nr:hypothetical protein An04g06220 [Aspergillus niger]CAK38883.1 hypothetical protein An04g06220 [Aspergillus niger]